MVPWQFSRHYIYHPDDGDIIRSTFNDNKNRSDKKDWGVSDRNYMKYQGDHA